MLMAHGGAEGELNKNEHRREDGQFFQNRIGNEYVPTPTHEPRACGNCDNTQKAKKRLGQHGVENANFILKKRDPQAPQEALNANDDKGDNAQIFDPPARLYGQQPSGQNHSEQPHARSD